MSRLFRAARTVKLLHRRPLVITIAAALVFVPALFNGTRANRDGEDHRFITDERLLTSNSFDCGYDPRGAEDELYAHRINALRLNKRANILSAAARTTARITDAGDTALIEDDGSIIVPPNKFDLNKSSVMFTPDGMGYRVAPADLGITKDYGFKLGFFFGVDGQPGNSNNGYHDINIAVRGPWFPFYGVYYDTLYIGTNGYITFGQGDASARISAASLASEMPRVAPLWADLTVSGEGRIYYNRLEGRHIVTWEAVPEVSYGGISTFQAVLYDDGRIAFVYKKVKARSAMIGISPGNSTDEAIAVDFSDPPSQPISGPFFESFSKQKRLDLPALMRAFYSAHDDLFDIAYIWTDFSYDNGLGVAHSFNVRNDIQGIGQRIFDRGSAYGSPKQLATIITMGNEASWPADPNANVSGIFSALSIVAHELGHRWLAYVLFDADHDIKDDLLGRDNSHWSFLADTRTNSEGNFSSLMEGNSWRDNNNGSFTTTETAAHHFSQLDQYLMGLRAAQDVAPIKYLEIDPQAKQILRERSPIPNFLLNAVSKTTSVAQIIEREGVRVPDVADAPKQFRVAFILLVEQGAQPSNATLNKVERYRDALVRYFDAATDRRGSLDASLMNTSAR